MADQKLNIDITAKDMASQVLKGVQTGLANIEKPVLSLGSAVNGLGNIFAASFSVYTIQAFGREMLQTAISTDKMRNSMTAATGSIGQAVAELEFVRKVANTLGLDLLTTTEAYMKLAAASKGTQLEGQAARDIFTAVANASTSLGLSADDTSGALRAIGQMISKGNVQAEELRGQLGERLPGAFQIAARAIGVSTMELDKMLKKGEVIAADFLPKFAIELQKSFGASEKSTQSAQAALNRFNTSVFEMKKAIIDNGGSDAVINLANSMTTLNRSMTDNILTFKEYELQVWNLFMKMGIIMDGGPLGMNWLTKSGRSEIGAELKAQEQMYAYQLRLVAEQRAGVVRAVNRPATPGGAGDSKPSDSDSAAKSAGTKTPASFFGAAWNTAAEQISMEDSAAIGFNSSLAFKGKGVAPFSILGPGGAEAWMAQAQTDRETKRAFLLEDADFENQITVALYQSKEATRQMDLESTREAEKTKQQLQQDSMQLGIGLLQIFGSKNKAAAMAALTLQKGLAIGETFVSTQAAAMRALAELGPIAGAPVAAGIETMGYVKMGLIAATGLAQAAMGGGASGAGTYASPIVTQPSTSNNDMLPGNITIHIDGNVISDDRWIEERLAPTIRELVTRRNVDFGMQPT